jgi:uncharacterized SAM-binding protein YcdF (DUF218 family)
MISKKTEGNKKSSSLANHPCTKFGLVILLFYFLIVLTHRFWLPIAADFLVFQNQPRKADLIVVATPFRPRFLYALNLLQRGLADHILLVGDLRIKMLWSGKTSVELAKNEAIKMGVPAAKIHVKYSTGTRADALQARTLMSSLGLKSAIVVSDPYNMRRLGMVFDHVFDGYGLELALVPTDQKRQTPDYWWLSPHSFVYVIKEWIKLPMNYYLLNSRTVTKVKPPEKEEKKAEELAKKFTEPELEMKDLFSKNFSKNLFRLIKFKIGAFLVVDESEMTTNAIITTALSPEISYCYQKEACKKIFLLSGVSGYTRNNFETEKIQDEINSKTKKLGINLNDLKKVPYTLGDAHQTAHFLNQFMSKNNLKSASFYLPYYETRKYKFYFNKYLNPDFTIHVKPLETSYRPLLEQWLQNAGLGNLYLDQYLIMLHYYFNKFLWSSRE